VNHYQQLEIPMAFQFNPSNVKAPVAISNKREQCHDLEGALAYLTERVHEMHAKDYFPWIKEEGAGYVVQVNLHSMPLYWAQFDAGKSEEVVIRNPDMSERTTRKAIVGGTMYQVASKEEGVQLLEALAGGENEDLNAILETACVALKEVDEIENPHIAERAEILYNEAGLDKTMGAFGEPDEDNANTGRKRISKAKTNKMNQYKQTARRQLGYARLKLKAD
jgi:hypothetical protein